MLFDIVIPRFEIIISTWVNLEDGHRTLKNPANLYRSKAIHVFLNRIIILSKIELLADLACESEAVRVDVCTASGEIACPCWQACQLLVY